MEYFLLIIEFYYIKGFRSLLISVFLPLLLCFLISQYGFSTDFEKNASNLQTNIITVLGILMGFTISTLTMLLTTNHLNIEKAKREFLDKKIFSRKISLFDSVQIGLAYLIVIQGFLLIFNFTYPAFIPIISLNGKRFLIVNTAFIIHIILILMRCILDFYFILSKRNT